MQSLLGYDGSCTEGDGNAAAEEDPCNTTRGEQCLLLHHSWKQYSTVESPPPLPPPRICTCIQTVTTAAAAPDKCRSYYEERTSFHPIRIYESCRFQTLAGSVPHVLPLPTASLPCPTMIRNPHTQLAGFDHQWCVYYHRRHRSFPGTAEFHRTVQKAAMGHVYVRIYEVRLYCDHAIPAEEYTVYAALEQRLRIPRTDIFVHCWSVRAIFKQKYKVHVGLLQFGTSAEG